MMGKVYIRYKFLFIALLISILLWVYVNNNQSNIFLGSNYRETFTLKVNLENVPEDIKVLSISNQKVLIRLENKLLLQQYDKSSFRAYIDLQDIKEGDNIRIVRVDAPSGVQVQGIQPGYIRITAAKIKK